MDDLFLADHYQARQAYPTNVQHHQQPFVMVHQGQQFVQGTCLSFF